MTNCPARWRRATRGASTSKRLTFSPRVFFRTMGNIRGWSPGAGLRPKMRLHQIRRKCALPGRPSKREPLSRRERGRARGLPSPQEGPAAAEGRASRSERPAGVRGGRPPIWLLGKRRRRRRRGLPRGSRVVHRDFRDLRVGQAPADLAHDVVNVVAALAGAEVVSWTVGPRASARRASACRRTPGSPAPRRRGTRRRRGSGGRRRRRSEREAAAASGTTAVSPGDGVRYAA